MYVLRIVNFSFISKTELINCTIPKLRFNWESGQAFLRVARFQNGMEGQYSGFFCVLPTPSRRIDVMITPDVERLMSYWGAYSSTQGIPSSRSLVRWLGRMKIAR